jgi:hypothetical protein
VEAQSYKDVSDKIIHVLYAAYYDSEFMYNLAKSEYTLRYGLEALDAIATFEVDYKPNITVYR